MFFFCFVLDDSLDTVLYVQFRRVTQSVDHVGSRSFVLSFTLLAFELRA